MNKEQIIDVVYENYITQTRIEFEKWCERNPDTLVNYREDTKELFLKSIKEDTHWFTGEKKFSETWRLKIEERELSFNERIKHIVNSLKSNAPLLMEEDEKTTQWLNENNIPTKLITLTYNNEKIESYE